MSASIETNFSLSGISNEPKAGFWWRALGHICDNLMVSLVVFPFSFIGELFQDSNATLSSALPIVGFGVGVYAYVQWIGLQGGSPLRRKTGLLILDQTDGSFIGPKRAFIRILMSYVSGLVLFLGYLSMLWNPNKQTWHDKVARTVVVKR